MIIIYFAIIYLNLYNLTLPGTIQNTLLNLRQYYIHDSEIEETIFYKLISKKELFRRKY